MSNVPMAMEAPKEDVILIQNSMIDEAIKLSRISPRKRIILPLHKSPDDTLHRMFNVIQPGSYVRPHSHKSQGKSESIIVLRGGICYVTFDPNGNIKSYKNIIAGTAIFGVDSEPHIIHTFFALKEDTVVFEVKPGPYIKALDKGFEEWAPDENTMEAKEYLQKLMTLTNNQNLTD